MKSVTETQEKQLKIMHADESEKPHLQKDIAECAIKHNILMDAFKSDSVMENDKVIK